MRRSIVVGYGLLLAAAVGCGGGGSSTPDAGGVGGDAGTLDAAVETAVDHPPPSTPVTLSSSDALVFAAGQDGDGAWRQLTGAGTAGSYVLDVTGARYGFAYGCGNAAGDNISITIIHATVAETARVTVACGAAATETPVTITGTVAGLSGMQTAQIDVGGRSGTATAAAPGYSVMPPAGMRDLFARRLVGAPTFDRMIRRNAVTIAAGATFDLDFATEGFAPETRTVTFQGAAATDTTSVLVIFRNAGGSPFSTGSFPSGTYLAIPAAELRAGDYHSVVAGVSDAFSGTTRRVRRIFTGAMNFTALLPEPQPISVGPGMTVPYLRPRLELASPLGADRDDVTFSQAETTPARTRTWSVQITRGWAAAAGTGTVEYFVPDLSAVVGYQAWWGLTAGSTQLQLFSNWSDAGVADLLRADQTVAELDGREYKIVQTSTELVF